MASACGGGKKKPPKPVPKGDVDKPPPAPPETEEDREKKRAAAAKQIVPEGVNCLPVSLKGSSAPRLELASIEGDARLCAVDTERERLLGPVACWKLEVPAGILEYTKAAPLPGRGFTVKLDDRCARGYCLPKDAKAPAEKIAHMVWSPDGSKVAVNIGDDIHLYDASTKARTSSFSIRGDKGVSNEPSRLYWVGERIFVEGADAGPYSAVWVFRPDGTQDGPIEAIGAKKDAKPLSTFGGSFLTLDKARVAVSEQGMTWMTTYEVDTGKRTKVVRNKLPKAPCKADELEAFWNDTPDKLTPKCKEHMTKNFSHLIGADVVAGQRNLLVLLRDTRLGELAVMDPKTLVESKAPIKLAWCPEGDDAKEKKDDAKKAEKAKPAAKTDTRKKEDPDAGGE